MTGETILVIAAHPDDEALICGGTMARHAGDGDSVHVLFAADGETARFADPADAKAAAIARRKAQAADAAEILGAEAPRFLDLPDNRLDSVALLDLVKAIEAVVAEIAPATVYTHFGHDLNIDHAITHNAVMTACRALPGRSITRIFAGETLSSSEWSLERRFRPNAYVALGPDQLARKRAALAAYGAEMPPAPHARSADAIEALLRTRGAEAGLDHAEAFELIRDIRR